MAHARGGLKSGLYVVATPIGNAKDITLRALDVLMQADKVYCEDTRITKKLFSLHGIQRKPNSYHEHSSDNVRAEILHHLENGLTVALVSDAGTPLISDPGYRLVKEARDAGQEVFSVPGASSPIAALSISGLPSDRFLFAGFLPTKSAARQTALGELVDIPVTLVLFESPKRLTGLLKDIDAVMPDREAAICREMTKAYEEVLVGAPAELIETLDANASARGEVVVLIHPPAARKRMSEADVRESLRVALQSQPLKTAAARVAALSGWSKRDVYQLALTFSENKDE
jgi:16S rRNA (cytidine1402-2'-O)-methyltransferase